MKTLSNQELKTLNNLKEVERKISLYYDVTKTQYELAYYKENEINDFTNTDIAEEEHYKVLIYSPLKFKTQNNYKEYMRIFYREKFNGETHIKIELAKFTHEEFEKEMEYYKYL